MKKKLLFSVFSLVLVAAMSVTSVFAATSKDKTCTQLTDDDTTTVTLSLPADETPVSADVVFVLDGSSCSSDSIEKAQDMVNALAKHVEESGATVNIGAVAFKGAAATFDLVSLTSENSESMMKNIVAFVKENQKVKGSNLHAGLLAAKTLLESDKDTPDNRKYVVVISDGITYSWDDNGTQKGVDWVDGDGNKYYASNSAMEVSVDRGLYWHPENNDWGKWFEDNSSELQELENNYASEYTRDMTQVTLWPTYGQYKTCTCDIAMYKSMTVYNELAKSYNAYAIALDPVGYGTQYGYYFMQYLNGGIDTDTIFDNIENDIIYLVDSGSKVVDTIGESFDLTDINSFNITVGGVALDKTVSGNTVTFGDASNARQFVITYEDGDTEKFTVDINVPIKIQDQVKISYDLKLIRKTEPGEYTVPTNESAVLTPVNTKDEVGEEEYFPVPEITYSVEKTTPSDPDNEKEDNGGGSDSTDDDTDNEKPDTSASGSTALYLAMMAIAGAGIVTVSKRNRK